MAPLEPGDCSNHKYNYYFSVKKKTPDKLRLKCQVFCLLNKYHNLSKGFLLLIVKRTKKIKYNLNCVARLNDKN